MHIALQNPQILTCIVHQILAKIQAEPDTVRYDALQRRVSWTAALLAFVKTCKPFYGAGLRWLWMKQMTLDNLVKCLPPAYWKKDGRWTVSAFSYKKSELFADCLEACPDNATSYLRRLQCPMTVRMFSF